MKARLIYIFFLICLVNITTIAANPGISDCKKDSVYWSAVKYYQEENYSQSLLLFQCLLTEDAENIELNYYTGMCYFNLHKLKMAKWHLSIAAVDNCCRMKIMLLTRSDMEDTDILSYNN